MAPNPAQRAEIEEKLQKAVERRMADQELRLASGDSITVPDAVTIIVEEVEDLRQQLIDFAPGPSIPPTDEQVQRLFKLPVTSSTPTADGWEWTFMDGNLLLHRDFSTGEWLVTLAP
jgi:hypothetical protein